MNKRLHAAFTTFLFSTVQLCAELGLPHFFHENTENCFSKSYASQRDAMWFQKLDFMFEPPNNRVGHESVLTVIPFLSRLQVLRVRGGRIKYRQRLDEENERVAGLALKKLKNHPFFGLPDVNTSHTTPTTDETEIVRDLLEVESRRRSSVNARSLLWNLNQRTALCIVLPDEFWPAIQKVRLEYDRWVNRWFNPVIVLFNPFFPLDLLGECI